MVYEVSCEAVRSAISILRSIGEILHELSSGRAGGGGGKILEKFYQTAEEVAALTAPRGALLCCFLTCVVGFELKIEHKKSSISPL